MIYFIIVILLLVFTYFYDYKREKRGIQISFYLTLFLFISVAGLRYKVGGDTSIYMDFFDDVHTLNNLKESDFVRSRFAPGFVFLTSLIKTICNDYVFFQLVHAIIVNGVIFFFVKKHCRNFFFAIFIFFNFLYFYLLFEQVRESFAVTIFLLAWPSFKKGIWWQWYFASVLAFLFHISAFIMFFLPLINLPGLKWFFTYGKKTIYICFGVLILAFVIQTTLFRYIEMVAVTESMLDRAQAYGDLNSIETFNLNKIIGSIIQYIAYPLLSLYCLWDARKQRNYDNNNVMNNELVAESKMVLLSIYISLFSIFVGIFVRYNNYFFLFSIIVMADWAFSKIHIARKYIRLGYIYWILFFIPMLGFNFYMTHLVSINKTGTLKGYMMYYPYYSVLEQKEDQNREKTITYIRRSLK